MILISLDLLNNGFFPPSFYSENATRKNIYNQKICRAGSMEHTSVSYSRAKRKFLQVEDMPRTQTLVNLVSILSACKQDFLYHKNDPIFSSKCLETSDLFAWEALPRYNSELMIIMKAMLCKSLKTSLSPEDENVCRVHAWPAGIPLANRQLHTF